MRIYDPRLGRFLSRDPLIKSFPFYTPYQFASNTPIIAIDLDGLEAVAVNPNVQTLIITVQGVASMGNDRTSPQHTLVDNISVGNTVTSVRDKGLGELEFIMTSENTQVITYTASTDDKVSDDVFTTIYNFKKNNPKGKIILIGHSQGAVNVNDAAGKLEQYGENSELKNNKIDLIITLDAASKNVNGKVNLEVPSNVENALNYYENTTVPMGNSSVGKSTAVNSNTTDLLNLYFSPGGKVDHRNIDNSMLYPITNILINFIDNKKSPIDIAKQNTTIPVVKNDSDGGSSTTTGN